MESIIYNVSLTFVGETDGVFEGEPLGEELGLYLNLYDSVVQDEAT